MRELLFCVPNTFQSLVFPPGATEKKEEEQEEEDEAINENTSEKPTVIKLINDG